MDPSVGPAEGITMEFFTDDVQWLHVDSVLSDEASPPGHWKLLPLYVDLPGLMVQHRQARARNWFLGVRWTHKLVYVD